MSDKNLTRAPARDDLATAVERIVVGGDLSQLTPAERTNHYLQVCAALRLDWRTRPFDYLKDRSGKLVMYARKDCTEQLRRRDGVSLTLPSTKIDSGLYVVTAHAVTKDGRHDEDIGAVAIDKLAGEFRANAMLKAVTKAKRRVTLSICGVGLPDETEVDSIPGAVRVAAELPEGAAPSGGYEAQDVVGGPPPPPPLPESTPPPPPGARATPEDRRQQANDRGADPWVRWVDTFAHEARRVANAEEAHALLSRDSVVRNYTAIPHGFQRNRFLRLHNEIVERWMPKPDEPPLDSSGPEGPVDWDDPLRELLAEVDQMDMTTLLTLDSNAEWRVRVRDAAAFPPDEDRLRQHIAARKAALRPQ